jgi:hypothetical protein
MVDRAADPSCIMYDLKSVPLIEDVLGGTNAENDVVIFTILFRN